MPVHQQFRRRTFLIVRDCSMTGTHLRSPTSAGGLEEPIGKRPIEVVRVRTTDAGRLALAG
jgi:hypothetical protein